MVTVSRFYGIEIIFRFNDHDPPHFHAKYGEYWLEFGIRPLQVLAGNAPRRVVALVMEWAQMHEAELATNWDACRTGGQPSRIDPLR